MIAALALLAVGCTSEDSPSAGESRPSGTSSEAPPPSPLSGGALTCGTEEARSCTDPGTLRWSVPLQGDYRFRDGTQVDAVVAAYDGDDRREGLVRSGAGVAGDLLVLVSGGRVLAVDLPSGTVRWRAALGADRGRAFDPYAPRPVTGDGLVVVVHRVLSPDGSDDEPDRRSSSWLVTFDAETGQLLGSFQHPSGRLTGIAIVNGILWLADERGGQLIGIDARAGVVRHRVSVPLHRSMPVQDGVLHTHDADPGKTNGPGDDVPLRRVIRVDLRTGERLPDLPVPRRLQTFGRFTDGPHPPGVLLLFHFGQPPEAPALSALDARTGRALWSAPPVEQPDRSLSLAQCHLAGIDLAADPATVYVCGPRPHVITVRDARTGARVGQELPDREDGRTGGVTAGRTLLIDHKSSDVRGGIGPDRVSVHDLRTEATLGTLEMLGRYEPVLWPPGHTRGHPTWTSDGAPLTIYLACAPDGATSPGGEGSGTRCTKPRLLAINR